jgi:hypothetical protein
LVWVIPTPGAGMNTIPGNARQAEMTYEVVCSFLVLADE